MGMFAILAAIMLKRYGLDTWGGFLFGVFGGTISMLLFLPRWTRMYHDARAPAHNASFDPDKQAALEAAELELMELRQQRGTEALENIRGLLHDDLEYRALLERAEAAERMIESMDKQLREQAEKIKRDRSLVKHMAARLEGAPIVEPQETQTDTSLAFPYSTKQLEAMRDAATKYWQAHDRAKPAPHGIQKQVQIFLSERIGNSDRKVAELAAAIKPDDLPEK